MFRFRIGLTPLCLALVVSACTSDKPISVDEQALFSDAFAIAGETAKSGEAVTKPFRGAADAESMVSAGPQPCMFAPEVCAARCPNAEMPTWVIGFAGEGRATHIGRFEATFEHCSVVEFDPDLGMPVGAVYGDGMFEIVAANGDGFSGTYGSYGVDGDGISSVVAPGVGDFHDKLVITAGTGRFANATADIREDGLFDLATGAITSLKMHGTITYAASDRSDH